VTRLAYRILINGCFMLASAFVVTAASADAPKETQKDKSDKGTEPDVGEEYKRDAAKLMSTIEMEFYIDEQWTKVKQIEKPLLYYGDPTRDNDRGSLWGWGDKGRPVALLELWQGVNNRATWHLCVCNTSGRKVRATRGGDTWWSENDSEVELKDVPDAAAPSTDATKRQLQLNQLAKKFSGYEFWDPNNSRYELRRLEKPVRTYKDEDDGIVEGALYILANGTNPEILVFLEARTDPKDKKKTSWQFAAGRSALAELHVDFDGKEVYQSPRQARHGSRVSGPNKPFWLSFINN
jgi:hypothetical protein